ncbi:SIR2 family protein [[Bacillus] enclensis]|uniref:SIR2 family protein n=1 Tax=[Bacillus] enclensis TaxID=1402860 RepID=UPI0018DBE56D|nr:SIR2 family protein [[Bacillus] enclensis]
MIDWPHQLIKDIARRRTVLFLGSGISRNSINQQGNRPPTWEDFLRKAVNTLNGETEHIKTLLDEKDYLTACEIIYDKLGAHSFNEFALESFMRPGFEKHRIHEAIFKLDSRIVATPNVDKIYDTFANQESRGTIMVKNYYDNDLADKLRSEDRMIIKVHGTIELPDKMIFTRKQYTTAKYKNSAFYKLLDSLALTHTFIFLGCGLNDPDIRLILENYAHLYPNSRPHYMVTSSESINDDLKRSIRVNANLELLSYSSMNNHKELCTSLEYLAGLVEEERDRISENQNW